MECDACSSGCDRLIICGCEIVRLFATETQAASYFIHADKHSERSAVSNLHIQLPEEVRGFLWGQNNTGDRTGRRSWEGRSFSGPSYFIVWRFHWMSPGQMEHGEFFPKPRSEDKWPCRQINNIYPNTLTVPADIDFNPYGNSSCRKNSLWSIKVKQQGRFSSTALCGQLCFYL